MTADIITDATYPHGTPEGYTNGCRGSHCPAKIACRNVHLRYSGDYAFRKLIDTGITATQIIEREEAEAEAERIRAQEAAQAAKDAQKAHTRELARIRHNEARRTKRATQRAGTKKGDGIARTPLQVEISRLHGLKLTDTQIAEHLGKKRNQVKGVRLYLHLPPNPAPATTGASSLEAT